MGADIHIYAERRLKDGSWSYLRGYDAHNRRTYDDKPEKQSYGNLLFSRARSRDYGFFADLAGVRGPGPAPKGLPDDVSPLVAEESELYGGDGHSHSWYSAKEFVPIFMKHHLTNEERAEIVTHKLEGSGTSLTHHVLNWYLGIDVPYGKDDKPDPSAIRFVFWFDN